MPFIERFDKIIKTKIGVKICLPKQTSTIIFSPFEQKICFHNDMRMFPQWLENKKKAIFTL
jgi:hypothetical protein